MKVNGDHRTHLVNDLRGILFMDVEETAMGASCIHGNMYKFRS
jgi:hypothetical protein